MHALGLRFSALAMVALAAAACATAAVDGSVGGAGGDGSGSGPSTSTHGAGSTHATGTGTTGNGPTTSGGPTTVGSTTAGPSTGTGPNNCDSLDCASCQSCAFAPGGACETQWNACNANTECMAFGDCINNCPFDDPNTPTVNEELNCICSNDGNNCDGNLTPGTCMGDHSTGMNDYSAVGECLFTVACVTACQ